ncbi:COQ9 family protein [Roseovarius salinarum]|uniref:COQ9 family protein n=1 Tax=Roseovarius salinarum TaxID=1981892 RepID=UPI000C34EEBF|nr:COQ9 family protein [Roseovarius salinarum]
MSDQDIRTEMLEAAKMHVPFDGWSDAALAAAARDAGVDIALARAVFPRGGVDLALAYHEAGDRAMLDRLEAEADTLAAMRFRDRIAAAVRFRIEAIDDRELARRGATLFALPQHAPDGARAIWRTCDRIWTALGDTADDVNWYTKRATLSGVYSSTLLYWLGDNSPEYAATWDFLDRRIEDVMQFEKVKAQVRDNRVLGGLLAGPMAVLGKIRPPRRGVADMPGRHGGDHH